MYIPVSKLSWLHAHRENGVGRFPSSGLLLDLAVDNNFTYKSLAAPSVANGGEAAVVREDKRRKRLHWTVEYGPLKCGRTTRRRTVSTLRSRE